MSNLNKVEPQSPLSTIQKIKSGQLNPRLLKKQERQLCVEMFLAEGYANIHMAEILRCSTKTIQRDISDVHKRKCISFDKDAITIALGRLNMATIIHRNHLMRLARDKNASVMERVQAECSAFKVMTDAIKIYQSLGLLNARMLPNDQVENLQTNKDTAREQLTEDQMNERLKHNLRSLIKYGNLSLGDLIKLLLSHKSWRNYVDKSGDEILKMLRGEHFS